MDWGSGVGGGRWNTHVHSLLRIAAWRRDGGFDSQVGSRDILCLTFFLQNHTGYTLENAEWKYCFLKLTGISIYS